MLQGMKHMAAEMQRELEATRTELRRGILELPQETAESTAQMRRVIVDQIEALAELNSHRRAAWPRHRSGRAAPRGRTPALDRSRRRPRRAAARAPRATPHASTPACGAGAAPA